MIDRSIRPQSDGAFDEFSSSRTFPGQSYCSMDFMAAFVIWMELPDALRPGTSAPAWGYQSAVLSKRADEQ